MVKLRKVTTQREVKKDVKQRGQVCNAERNQSILIVFKGMSSQYCVRSMLLPYSVIYDDFVNICLFLLQKLFQL